MATNSPSHFGSRFSASPTACKPCHPLSRVSIAMLCGRVVLFTAIFGRLTWAMSVTTNECAVVGCGVLGTSLCKQLIESPEFSNWKVTGITKSENKHNDIRSQVGESERFEVKTADKAKGEKYQNVVFCAPPSGFEDYPGAIDECITETWAGPDGGGVFVFTSSGGIYGPGTTDLVVVNEDSPLPDPGGNLRSARLISAEKVVLSKGGACLRLAGLYTLGRGAHSFWMASGKDVSGREDGIINLLHYDDAAGAVKAALLAGSSVVNGNVFLISDGHPLSRRGICESALKAKKYQSMKMPKFLGTDMEPIGKIYDGSASNLALKWDPTYVSFDRFMSDNA